MKSFEGFLLKYCQELTGLPTTSIKAFYLACSETPRAAEAVMLLAVTSNKTHYLARLSSGTKFGDRFVQLLRELDDSGHDVQAYLNSLPATNRFRKVYLSWVSERNALDRDRATAGKIALLISDEISRMGISRAEACRKLGLNKGNFYAFLKGDSSKLSRESAVKAYKSLKTQSHTTA